MGGFQNNVDVWQKEFEAEGVQGTIRVVEHPDGKAFFVDIRAVKT